MKLRLGNDWENVGMNSLEEVVEEVYKLMNDIRYGADHAELHLTSHLNGDEFSDFYLASHGDVTKEQIQEAISNMKGNLSARYATDELGQDIVVYYCDSHGDVIEEDKDGNPVEYVDAIEVVGSFTKERILAVENLLENRELWGYMEATYTDAFVLFIDDETFKYWTEQANKLDEIETLENELELEYDEIEQIKDHTSGKGDITDDIANYLDALRLMKATADVDMSVYEAMGLDWNQMYEIRSGLKNGIDVSVYADKTFGAGEMEAIRLGLEAGVDVSVYADKNFNEGQMRQIRIGLESGLDVSVYSNPKLTWYQMYDARTKLEKEQETKTNITHKPAAKASKKQTVRGPKL